MVELKVNFGLIFNSDIDTAQAVIEFLKENDAKLIYMKKSTGRLWVKEGAENGDE